MKLAITLLIFAVVIGVIVLLTRTVCPQAANRLLPAPHPILTIDEAADWLEAGLGLKVRRYSTFDFGRERDTNSVSIIVRQERAERLLAEVRAALPSGLVAFIGTTRWYGDEKHNGVELVVSPGQSQFDILRVARSDAVNYNLATEDMNKKLQLF